MLVAVVAALVLQQTPAGQIVWQPQPDQPAPAAPAAPPPPIPDWARNDPYGYERSECSPLMRSGGESLQACQTRVRAALAANLGASLPAGLAPEAAADECRQTAAGDRYALQCGVPPRSGAPSRSLTETTCETRPQAQPNGTVTWTEQCRPADGTKPAEGGLRLRLGGE